MDTPASPDRAAAYGQQLVEVHDRLHDDLAAVVTPVEISS
jgi:hypothetical protein